MKTLKAHLKNVGARWSVDSRGMIRIYFRTAKPQRMADGTWWSGTETVGRYASWEEAAACGSVKALVAK